MSELKPCPFCGSRAVMVECGTEDGDPNAGGTTVECVACRASAPVAFGENAHNAVCIAWNRRAPQGGQSDWPEKMTEKAFVKEIIRRCDENNEPEENSPDGPETTHERRHSLVQPPGRVVSRDRRR